LGGEFSQTGDPKKNPERNVQREFGKKCKNHHDLENVFLELTRAKQECKKLSVCWLTSSQIWLIAFVEDCQSTNLAKLKKTNPAQSPVIKCSNGGRVHKIEDHI
jgi:hypothetical protein